MSDKPTLRAQACRFKRLGWDNKPEDWEPGIAFLKAFGVSDVDVIIGIDGEPIRQDRLYNYELLRLRVDGYIGIDPCDYEEKRQRGMLDPYP